MTNRTLLTLGLPVYNGEECLGDTLESISFALRHLENIDLIEILVSDNMSIDKTADVVNRYIRDGLKVRYSRNETNIGYDKNIDTIVSKANGKYVWFLGCGEKVKENSLTRLVTKLDNDMDYTNILVDFDIYDELKDKITDIKNFSITEDMLIKDKNDFRHNKYAPAVSSNIINKDKWMKVYNEKLVVDGWCHIERILSMIALDNHSLTLILTEPYFTLFREKNGWWTKPNSYLLLLLHIDVIESMLKKGFNKDIVHKLKYKQSRMAVVSAVVSSKGYGLKVDMKILKDMIAIFKKDYFFWLFVLPVLLMPQQLYFIPKSILNILRKVKKVLKHVKKTFF